MEFEIIFLKLKERIDPGLFSSLWYVRPPFLSQPKPPGQPLVALLGENWDERPDMLTLKCKQNISNHIIWKNF